MQEQHFNELIKCLNNREDWTVINNYLFTPTKNNYYLDFLGEGKNIILRYKIEVDEVPCVVAEQVATGTKGPLKAFNLKDEIMMVAAIKGMPRKRRRKAMRDFEKMAKSNDWALKVRERLISEEE